MKKKPIVTLTCTEKTLVGKDVVPQSGRSLTEMLATLAIMGVLTIGAIAGFSYAMNRQRANQIIHDARVGYYDEYGAENPHTEWFRIKTLETDRPMFVMRDKLGRIYVKAESVGKDVCWHLLRAAAENILSFYNTDNTEMTSCPAEENDIVIAFNGVSAPAECAVWGDCGEEFDGYCNSDGRCSTCDDNEMLNQDKTGCVCDPELAVTCTHENASWCCGKDEDGNGLICGENSGECIDGGGVCSYRFSGYDSSSNYVTQCHYSLSDSRNVSYYYGDCSYSVSDSTNVSAYESDCSYEIPTSTGYATKPIGNTSKNLATLSLSRQSEKCPANKYCSLFWVDRTDGQDDGTWVAPTKPSSAGASATGKIYGKCQTLASYDSTPKKTYVNGASDVARVSSKCPVNKYCALFWGGEPSQNGNEYRWTSKPSGLSANATGAIYGKCQTLASYDSTPLTKNINGNGAVVAMGGTRGGCPANKYCALFWSKESWTGTAPTLKANATNDLYGKCQTLSSYDSTPILSGSSDGVQHRVVQGCPVKEYCLIKWRENSCTGLQPSDLNVLAGACVPLRNDQASCPY